MPESLPNGELAECGLAALLLPKLTHYPVALLRLEPARLSRPVGHDDQNGESRQNRGKTFQNKHPTPGRKPQPVHPQNEACDWTANSKCDRARHDKARHGAAPKPARE